MSTVTQAAAPARRALLPRPAAGDFVAGFSVALVLIPQSLAYAELAGVPAYRGLYAAIFPLLAAVFFASSRYLQTGPVAITAILTFGALSELAAPASGEYIGLAMLLAVVVGAVRLALGLLRAGVIAWLMSQPLLMGFVPGAAVLIAFTQVPTALGVHKGSGGAVSQALTALVHPGRWELEAVVISALTIVVVLAASRVHRLFPGVLIASAAAIVYSVVTGYGGATIGDIPAGLPPLSFDLPWGELPGLLLPGAVIAVVGFAEPAAISRALAAHDREPWDADRELVGQGAANLASGFTGGFPVGGSFSRSSLNAMAGARSRWSGGVTGLCVLLFLPFSELLADLPTAVLGGIVISAVARLFRPLPALRLWRVSRPQFAIAAATFALTLALEPHVERAVVAGVAMSLAVHLWRELALDVQAAVDGDVLELCPHGVLWFGNAQRLQDALLSQLSEHRGVRELQLRLGALGRIDTTGALALRSFAQDARSAGLALSVLDVPPHARRLLPALIEREDASPSST